MKIQVIEINGLYDTVNFTWELDSRVNILSGINGSLKTTLIKIIYNLCTASFFPKDPQTQRFAIRLRKARIGFTNGCEVQYRQFNDNLAALEQEARSDELLGKVYGKISADYGANSQVADRRMVMDTYAFKKDGREITENEFRNLVKLSIVDTFDNDVEAADAIGKKKSSLDVMLQQIGEQYAYFQSDEQKARTRRLIDRIEENLEQSVSPYALKEALESYKRPSRFVDIVNGYFQDTHKRLNIDSSRIEFIMDTGEVISSSRLSSGEKQLLIILITVLMQKEQECILLMDEPEISLHIDWQRALLNTVQELNPNCQVITTTHSPSMIMGGWKEFVTYIDDLKF